MHSHRGIKNMAKQHSESDRRLRQAGRLARVLRILQLLQGRGCYNAESLAAEQECSVRTVYRDLEVLEFAGVPWYFDQEQHCYRVRPDFSFPVLNLSDDELLGQATATLIAAAPGLNIGAGAKATTEKLAAMSAEERGKLLEDVDRVMAVLDLKLADESRNHEIIRSVQWALLQRKQVIGRYVSPYEPTAKQLRLHPYRLCLVKRAWYLIGRPDAGDEPRTYRIGRFKSLRMIDFPAEVPADFDLKKYFGNAWGVYRGDRSYDVEIAFSPEAAAVVTETTWHQTQKVHRNRDGSVVLSFRVDGLNEIVNWVLGWAGKAKVIKPPELRRSGDPAVCGKL